MCIRDSCKHDEYFYRCDAERDRKTVQQRLHNVKLLTSYVCLDTPKRRSTLLRPLLCDNFKELFRCASAPKS